MARSELINAGRMTGTGSFCELGSHAGLPWLLVAGLLRGGRLELDDEVCRHPPAVLYLDPLRFGPFANLVGVRPTRRSPAAAVGRPPGTAADPPGGTHIAGQGIPQFLGMPAFRSIS